jgi:hypothetical protein
MVLLLTIATPGATLYTIRLAGSFPALAACVLLACRLSALVLLSFCGLPRIRPDIGDRGSPWGRGRSISRGASWGVPRSDSRGERDRLLWLLTREREPGDAVLPNRCVTVFFC